MHDDRVVRSDAGPRTGGRPIIARSPARAADHAFDLIVVGGGIHGAFLTLEAARRGLRVLLLEQHDFGGATSFNAHRIIHGGLRYIQSLDIRRARESIAEQRWFLLHFPDLVRPLQCLMPLYSRGLRRPFFFKHAVRLHRWARSLTPHDGGIPHVLPRERPVLSNAQAMQACPLIDQDGLAGCGQWFDALLANPQRLLLELLRSACGHGATALNYVGATNLLAHRGRVAGVEALDKVGDRMHTYDAPVVINCAGPWARELATRFDRDTPDLLYPSLAFNVLLRRRPHWNAALAASAKSGGSTFFLVPWSRHLCIGTLHVPWQGRLDGAAPSAALLHRFLAEVNEAVPSLQAEPSEVHRVFAGILPAVANGSAEAASRPAIVDHGKRGGPAGLFSVMGVKYTTARAIARRTLATVFPSLARATEPEPYRFPPATTGDGLDLTDSAEVFRMPAGELRVALARMVREEAVVHLDDLVLRRTDWGSTTDDPVDVGARICDLLEWGGGRRRDGLQALATFAGRPFSSPPSNTITGPSTHPEIQVT